MGFWTLFEVASMPILQVLIINVLGAFLATEYCNLLPAATRKQMNMIVIVVFTPSFMFASLANTVTFQDMLSWWYLPVNISLIFIIGGILGWILVKILKPEPQLEGLVIATCSAGNLGCLLLIVIPAICNENGNPFGDKYICSSVGLSYASFSMALGGFFIWTHTYYLVRTSAIKFREIQAAKDFDSKIPNKDFDANEETSLLKGEKQEQVLLLSDSTIQVDTESQVIAPQVFGNIDKHSPFWGKIATVVHQIVEELFAPPTIGSILGFIFGATPWLRGLIVGNDAPLHVIQDTVKLL